MSRRNALKYLLPAVKKRLVTELAAVETLSTPIAVPVFEWGSHFNETMPYVIIGQDPRTRPSDTTNTLGNEIEVWLDVYSSSDNNGIFEIESIVDAVVGALEYKAANTARAACGVQLTIPNFTIIGAESVRIDGAADPENAHRRIVVMEYVLNQVA